MSRSECKTAYSPQQAVRYDADRFTTRSGRKIHEIEFHHLENAIQAITRKKQDFRMLEVGCGTGRLLIELAKRNFRIDGVDASTDMCEQCRKKIEGLFSESHLTIAEAAHLPYPDNSYAFAYSIRLLNQTESPAYALTIISEMIRVVEPGGYVLVEFVNLFRPRLGRSPYKGVRLRPRDVIDHAYRTGAKRIWVRGAFFFGMVSLNRMPDVLIDFVSTIDQGLSRLFPRLCSRCYILFRKDQT
ncbi:MAG TPA: class I SAM-dependent methyltransferase [Smithella sp.]|nr:class I SAM-dependent methyltransferase [Smithella sp.]